MTPAYDDRRASKAAKIRGELDTTLYFFYDGQEIIEERDGSENLVQQYVYGPNHIDELLMIFGKHGAHWVYTDANWNVIGLTNAAGAVAEEYNYTPYGRMVALRHTAFGDSDLDGDVDSTDDTAWEATQGGGGTYDPDFDADWDGDNDAYDEAAFDNNYNAAGDSVVVTNRAWSPSRNDYTYTARRLDPESMNMHYRARTYSPALKQFIQRDPLGYVDGLDLYEYVTGNPGRYVDPYGAGSTNPGGVAAPVTLASLRSAMSVAIRRLATHGGKANAAAARAAVKGARRRCPTVGNVGDSSGGLGGCCAETARPRCLAGIRSRIDTLEREDR